MTKNRLYLTLTFSDFSSIIKSQSEREARKDENERFGR